MGGKFGKITAQRIHQRFLRDNRPCRLPLLFPDLYPVGGKGLIDARHLSEISLGTLRAPMYLHFAGLGSQIDD